MAANLRGSMTGARPIRDQRQSVRSGGAPAIRRPLGASGADQWRTIILATPARGLASGLAGEVLADRLRRAPTIVGKAPGPPISEQPDSLDQPQIAGVGAQPSHGRGA